MRLGRAKEARTAGQTEVAPVSAVSAARRRLLLAGAAASLWLAGCTTARSPGAAGAEAVEGGQWSGRLSLRIDSEPAQSFAALFELRGAPGQGELKLSTPIGSTLGVLQWSPGEALLRDGQRVQREASIDLLLTRVTGAALPVDALFDWLAGHPAAVPGWRPQLTQITEGRLQAVRESPQPTAELRVVFEPAPVLRKTP